MVLPVKKDDVCYVFIVMEQSKYQSYEDYRNSRLNYLDLYMKRIKLENVENSAVIGIAVSTDYPNESSEDIALIDSSNWDDSYRAEAEEDVKNYRKMGRWNNKIELHNDIDYEYPTA